MATGHGSRLRILEHWLPKPSFGPKPAVQTDRHLRINRLSYCQSVVQNSVSKLKEPDAGWAIQKIMDGLIGEKPKTSDLPAKDIVISKTIAALLDQQAFESREFAKRASFGRF
jgi:hypothetical protein